MQISRICSILNIQGVQGRADLQQPAGMRNKAAREHEKMGLKNPCFRWIYIHHQAPENNVNGPAIS